MARLLRAGCVLLRKLTCVLAGRSVRKSPVAIDQIAALGVAKFLARAVLKNIGHVTELLVTNVRAEIAVNKPIRTDTTRPSDEFGALLLVRVPLPYGIAVV